MAYKAGKSKTGMWKFMKFNLSALKCSRQENIRRNAETGGREFWNSVAEIIVSGRKNPMRTLFSIGLIAAACTIGSGAGANPPQQDKEPLRLVQTIPLPNVKGRIDHMDVDVKGKRLFVAGLENGTLEVVDLKAGKLTRSIPGFKSPQGIAYLPSLNKVFVASNDDGMVRVFRADTFELLDMIHLDLGPNRVAYDSHTGLLYVG